MKSNITKKQYIIETYRILQEEGTTGLSIRRLAKELNCNIANLYRYFDGLEELLVYACIGFLEGYIQDISEIEKKNLDPMEEYFQIWNRFAYHSFHHPITFNEVFFGKYSSDINRITSDYYGMFPEQLLNLTDYNREVYRLGDFECRDLLALGRCVESNAIKQTEVDFLSKISIFLYKGMLKQVIDNETSESKIASYHTFFTQMQSRIFTAILSQEQ